VITISIESVNCGAILKCQGRIVRGEETLLLCAAIRQRRGTIILDVGGVEAIDAAGIGMLVSLQATGVYLVVLNPSEQVRNALRLTEVDSILQVCESKSVEETLTMQTIHGEGASVPAEAVSFVG
jgi:anti-anti-sigma factor